MNQFVANVAVLMTCRLCSKNSEKYHNLLPDAPIKEKVGKYLDIKFTDSDPHSKLICVSCFHRISEFDEYYIRVTQYQQYLQRIVQSQSICIQPQNSDEICVDAAQKHSLIVQDVIQSHSTDPTLIIIEKRESTYKTCSLLTIETDNYRDGNADEAQQENIANVSDTSSCSTVKQETNENEEESDNDNASISVCADGSFDDEDSEEEGECINQSRGQFVSSKDINLADFPPKLIENTKLLVKGPELVRLISKFYSLDCEYCARDGKQIQFNDVHDFLQHYTETHGMKGYVACCAMKLMKIHAMAMHMARHIQPEAFKCPECSEILTCPKILQYHIQNHLPEARRPLSCKECPRRFSYASALAAHTLIHQPEHERVAHICDECGKVFKSASRLTTHINVKHMKRNHEYLCHICSKQFTYGCNLAYHMTTHQPYAKQAQCEKCGKWLKNKFCLRKHICHLSTTRFNCTLCSYSSLSQQCLKNHMRVQHTDEKPFECGDCGKAFKLKKTLTAHMSQHTGVRNYVCEFCDRSFVSSGNYYLHRKRKHSNELVDLRLKQENEKRRLREMACQ